MLSRFENLPSVNTPLSADYLNSLLTEIETTFSKQMIIVHSAQQTFGTTYDTLKFNSETNKIGDRLTLDSTNYGVRIGKDISKVIINAYLNLGAYSDNQVPLVRVCKNGDVIQQYGVSCDAWNNDLISICGLLADVTEGDLITIMITGNSASVDSRINCYMSVEGIK